MLSKQIKDKLKANWGEKANSLECVAYVKVHGLDYAPEWAVFIYAMDPNDENAILTLTRDRHDYESQLFWDLNDLFNLFGENGDFATIDKEYKPKSMKTLLKHAWKY